jgi:gliding motility-associated-like protein
MPTVTATNNGPICAGGNVSFTSSGGGTYSWTGPNSFNSAVQNPTITGITTAGAGIYTVNVNLAGCLGTATTQVSISTPTASANNTGPYCAGQTISLIGSAGTTYTWTGPSGFNSNAQSPTIANATPAMSGTYNYTVNLGGCFASGSTPVVVNALPAPAPTNTGPYCAGSTIQLNVGAFNTYTWTGPSSFSSNSQNPTVPTVTSSVANAGVYTVSVTDANGCVNNSTTNVVVNPIPNPVANSNSPICAGSPLNLTSNGGTTYSWSGPNSFASALQNPSVPSASTLDAGVYTVTVTSLGCSNTATTNVIVSTASATASNSGPYCAGSPIVLSTSPATGYAWSGPGGYTSSAASPTIVGSTTAMAGTYSVIISIGTCTASAITNVIVNALPTPTASSNSPICAGNPLNFTGSSASTYTWTGPNSFLDNNQNPSIPTASTTASGTYTFAVTDANNCTNSITTNVVVNANPNPVVNSPTVCLNTTINLTSNGGNTYSWSGPNSYASAVQNPSIPNAQLNMSGAYTVTVTTAQGCTNTAIANVTVLSLPTPSITSNSPVCVGGQLTLGANGAATYQWTGPNSFNNSTQNPNINPVTMAANGVYTLVGTVGTCTASTTAAITINPLPNPNIITNSPICTGFNLNLSATGGTAFAWAGPNSFMSTNQTETVTAATVANAGTYTVVVTDTNGCVNFTTANVVVNPQPVVGATGTTVCENSSAQLTANGGVTYSWSGPGGYTSNVQNPILFNVGPASAGQYTVLVTDANTCTNTAVTSIGVNPAPTPSANVNTPICIGDIMNFTATGGVTYNWTGPNGFISSTQSPTVLANSTSASGIYQVTVTDANNCSATATINSMVNPNPVAQITSGPNVGCAPLCVNYTVQSIPTASLSYWTFGNGESANGPLNTISCYNTAGIYTINATVTDVNGCIGQTTYTAEVYPKPTADFNHAPLKPIINIDGDVVFTDASWGANIVTWNWYFMNTAQYTSTLQNPTFLYTEPGNYVVALIVKSDKGCSDTLLRPLVVGEDYGLYVPNAFTPNADGFNDLFQPKGFGIVKYELFVFDRWGEKLFHTQDFNEGWDGTYQGRGSKMCEEAVYTWLIECTDVFGKSHELKGHVTLLK